MLACRLLGLSYYLTQFWHIVNESLGTHFTESWNNTTIFMQENASLYEYENIVCKMSTILPRPRCVIWRLIKPSEYRATCNHEVVIVKTVMLQCDTTVLLESLKIMNFNHFEKSLLYFILHDTIFLVSVNIQHGVWLVKQAPYHYRKQLDFWQ